MFWFLVLVTPLDFQRTCPWKKILEVPLPKPFNNLLFHFTVPPLINKNLRCFPEGTNDAHQQQSQKEHLPYLHLFYKYLHKHNICRKKDHRQVCWFHPHPSGFWHTPTNRQWVWAKMHHSCVNRFQLLFPELWPQSLHAAEPEPHYITIHRS